MKKKIFALLMAMVLVLGMGTTALAADSSVGNNTPPTKLNVTWSATNPWVVEVEDIATEDLEVEYFVDILKDGEYVGNTGLWEQTGDKIVFDVSYYVAMEGNGNYTAEVVAIDLERNPVGSGVSAVRVYQPEKKLATPTNFVIDLPNDKLIFDQVDGAVSYQVFLSWSYAGSADYFDQYELVYDDNTSDGKVECDLQGFAEYAEHLKVDAADIDMRITFGVCAVSEDMDKVAWSEMATCIGYENKLTTEQAKEKLDEAFENVEEDPDTAIDALSQVSNDTITELIKTDAEFAAKVEKLDEVLIEDMGDEYKGATSKTDIVDASKVQVVGLAINAAGEGAASVELSFAKPEKEAVVPEGYEKGVQLDIALLTDGYALENLTVPVTITMPIPTGVDTKDLVILHYHGDATEPVVIVPTVNADGTMTFIVDGFSTFVVTNQVAETNDNTAGGVVTAPPTGDSSTTVAMVSLLLLAVGVVLMKRNAFAK